MSDIKFFIMAIVVSVLFFISFLLEIKNYFGYIFLSALILQGVKAIIDFCLGLPMQIGYSDNLENTEKNSIARIIGLLLGIITMAFALWWIFIKGV